MKKYFFILTVAFFSSFMNAQIHEIGVFLGGSNLVGDVGATTYIKPEKIAYGILYKWNKSPRHSYRFSYNQSDIYANDIHSDDAGRTTRGFKSKKSIKEFGAGIEFNFMNFNLHDLNRQFTPYVYSGVHYFLYHDLYTAAQNRKQDPDAGAFAIPVVVGVKTTLSPSLILGAEVGARYTFTDNLDGSNPTNAAQKSFRFGNLNNDDWYVFSGFTLTYTFGQKPCYCKE
jgi:Domain of unknown function (DUF6089)